MSQWTPAQIKQLVLDVRHDFEHVWNVLPAMRHVLIANKYTEVVMATQTATLQELQALWRDMVAAMETL